MTRTTLPLLSAALTLGLVLGGCSTGDRFDVYGVSVLQFESPPPQVGRDIAQRVLMLDEPPTPAALQGRGLDDSRDREVSRGRVVFTDTSGVRYSIDEVALPTGNVIVLSTSETPLGEFDADENGEPQLRLLDAAIGALEAAGYTRRR
ncbi:MAG: hypothetical protein AAGI17_11570 [Planctomycetota bacterium]